MDQTLEWPPWAELEAASMKLGLMLALGEVGWSRPPVQEAIFWRKLEKHMQTCDLDVVRIHGLLALCRLMYSQDGSP